MGQTRWRSSLKVEGECVFVYFKSGREEERERVRVRERERERERERASFYSAVVHLSMWLTAVLADTETRERPSMLQLRCVF